MRRIKRPTIELYSFMRLEDLHVCLIRFRRILRLPKYKKYKTDELNGTENRRTKICNQATNSLSHNNFLVNTRVLYVSYLPTLT